MTKAVLGIIGGTGVYDPEIIEDDFRLMKLAGCEALHLRLEPEEDEPPMTGVVGR